MKEKWMKFKQNKIVKTVLLIFNILATLIVIGILSVVLVQKFSNNRASVGGYGLYTVLTGSMIPRYNVADMILTKKVEAANINKGDDVVYEGASGDVNGRIVTHEIIRKEYRDGKYYFVTKGIANSLEDPEISEDQILGVVQRRLPVLSFCSHIINNPYGFYFIIFVPFVIYVFFEVIDISKEVKKAKKG